MLARVILRASHQAINPRSYQAPAACNAPLRRSALTTVIPIELCSEGSRVGGTRLTAPHLVGKGLRWPALLPPPTGRASPPPTYFTSHAIHRPEIPRGRAASG